MKRSDEQIKKDIVDELYWDTRIDASKVNVTVDGGSVFLSGEVPALGDIKAARVAAWEIAGVTDVTDNLTVSYTSPLPRPSDEDIRERAINLLTWDPVIDETTIVVTVVTGIVTLEGTVNAHWKRSFVENKMSGLNGVLTVENKLAVVPTEKIGDELIAQDVVDALERDASVNAPDVEVEMKDGVVTLSGRVPTWSASWAAEQDASRTAGVIDVRNHLQLLGAPEMQTA
ncbi:MAG: BON domain-containing protein [Opitutales bacterium]